MSVPVFPSLRKYYPGIDNPLFLGDITTADQQILDALRAVIGAGSTTFCILDGLEYTLGTPNTYTAGVIYFNGDFFSVAAPFNEGLYLETIYLDVLSETFNDSVARDIYINQVASPTSSPTGNTPLFTGNMNQYRIGAAYLKQQILSILTITNALGTTAYTNLGTGTGQVLTADQTYTQAQVNALLLSRAPSVVGSVSEINDFDGTFPDNFNGSGLGIVYPWYNSLTGERWGIMNGIATAGGNTAPNWAGKTTIGQGTDGGSNTFNEGTTYGANEFSLDIDNMPRMRVALPANSAGAPGSGGATYGGANNNTVYVPVEGNDGTPIPTTPTPLNMMQSSVAVYKVIRLV